MNANGQIMAGGSLPLWERGLKFRLERLFSDVGVAPLVGAWIEIGEP